MKKNDIVQLRHLSDQFYKVESCHNKVGVTIVDVLERTNRKYMHQSRCNKFKVIPLQVTLRALHELFYGKTTIEFVEKFDGTPDFEEGSVLKIWNGKNFIFANNWEFKKVIVKRGHRKIPMIRLTIEYCLVNVRVFINHDDYIRKSSEFETKLKKKQCCDLHYNQFS